MPDPLKIPENELEPSTTLAGAFGYTSDYVSKLAREGKVVGQQVGRVWYVNRQSLTQFADAVSKERLNRKEMLRRERKLERIRNTEVVAQVLVLPDPTHALARTVLFFALVATCAGLLYATATTRMTTSDVRVGIASIGSDLTSVFGDTTQQSQVAFLGWLNAWWWPFSSRVVVEDTNIAPTVPTRSSAQGLVVFDPSTSAEDVERVRSQFSDPVEVNFETVDSGLITPVFKDRRDETYRFLLVPVESSQ